MIMHLTTHSLLLLLAEQKVAARVCLCRSTLPIMKKAAKSPKMPLACSPVLLVALILFIIGVLASETAHASHLTSSVTVQGWSGKTERMPQHNATFTFHHCCMVHITHSHDGCNVMCDDE
jgi:hypothetical protein